MLQVQLVAILTEDEAWGLRQRAAEALATLDDPGACAALVRAGAEDSDEDVARSAVNGLETLLTAEATAAGTLEVLQATERRRLARLAARLEQLSGAAVGRLKVWLSEHLAGQVDPIELGRYGTDLSAELGRLPRGHYLDRAMAVALEVLEGDGRKALLFYGEAGVGKSAAVQELVHRLAALPEDRRWRVLRVSPSELMVGTKYLGEWETKLQKLIDAIAQPKRVLLYVTNIEGLGSAGRSASSETSMADLLAPQVEAGRIALVGEATPEAWKGGFGQSSALGRMFHRVNIERADPVFTRELLELVSVEAERELEPEFLDRLLELTSYHFSGQGLPGRAVGFLRQVLDQTEGIKLEVADLLQTLSRTSGIPVEVLDDDRPLDLAGTRAFLEGRVMGQTRAVERVLDLVTLVKAGLADPDKPLGVLMFVGPTGVGKTELARSLAELLFGSPDRLLRFDMSEYSSPAAHERLIGAPGKPGTLTAAVSEKPFSVLLLDEIEKANLNVFDLCLQVFDAGRLTDGSGRTVDFRRTIIILTSNVGSAVPTEVSLGFGGDAPPVPDAQSVQRELGRFFRPEFLGRIDQVVHFEPLAAETADRIARREVARMLERGGIRRRGLTVDVDPAVFSAVLREGYSPALGARPLKRTVERLLLLPVARVLASCEARRGAALRVGLRGGDVVVEVLAGDEEAPASEVALPPVELVELDRRLGHLWERAGDLQRRKEELLEESGAPGFWDESAGAAVTLDGLHRLDRLLGDLARLEEEVRVTEGNRDPRRRAQFVARHELVLRRLELLFAAVGDGSRPARDLGDAWLTLARARATGSGLDAIAMAARMYRAYARRLGLEATIASERCDAEVDEVVLALRGPGAHALLASEQGLHQFQREAATARGDRRIERELLRVEVDAMVESQLAGSALALEGRAVRASEPPRLVEAVTRELTALHRPTMVSATWWVPRNRRRDPEAPSPEHELQAYLAARIERGEEGPPAVVRRYRMGSAPLVRDRRTGRSSGRIDRVLRGELEGFLPELPSSEA